MRKQTTDLAKCNTQDLFDAANKGSTEALALLRERKADLASIGDISRHARTLYISKAILVDQAPGQAIAIEAAAEDVARRAAGDNPTPLERLLAGSIAQCWLDLSHNELQLALLPVDASRERFEHRSKMLSRAHNRYLNAIRTLAAVRRLDLTAIQVNLSQSMTADGGNPHVSTSL